jgi:hypothetical protein
VYEMRGKIALALFFGLTGIGCNKGGAVEPPKEAPKKEQTKKKAEKQKEAKVLDKSPAEATEDKKPSLRSSSGPSGEVHVAFYSSGSRTSIWFEGQSGVLSIDPKQTLWFGQGVLFPSGKGYHYRLISGGDYYSMTKPTLSKPLEEVLATALSTPENYKWEVKEMRGHYRPQLTTPSGKKVRLAMSKKEPDAPKWLKATVAGPRAKAVPLLPDVSIWSQKEGVYSNTPPKSAEQLKQKPGDQSLKTLWVKELGALRKGAIKLEFDLMVDLDADGDEEAMVCVTGGSGTPCYIYDREGSINQYHPVNIKYIGTPKDRAPLGFKLGDSSYMMHTSTPKKSKGGGPKNRVQLLRFDGRGYRVDIIQ